MIAPTTRLEAAMDETYRSMSFGEYWRTYFPDLVEPLPRQSRTCILDKLYCAFVEEQYAGREVVQRLVEVHEGKISVDQYFAWAMSDDAEDGTEHMLAHLASGEYINGSRTDSLRVLGSIEYSPAFAAAVRCAADDGVLSPEEVVEVLSRSLRNAPLPRFREAPPEVPTLPFRRVMSDDSCECHPDSAVEHATAS